MRVLNKDKELSTDQYDWIERIKYGNGEELQSLYELYRNEFISWSGSMFKLREEEAADIFQDAVITFYWNIKKDKLSSLSSSVKTYLFAIGKNLALKKIKKDKRLIVDNEVMAFNANDIEELSLEYSQRQKLIASLLSELGEPCKSILHKFYFSRFSMDAIAQDLGYKNEHVVKSQKLRCLKKLKGLFDDQALQKDDV